MRIMNRGLACPAMLPTHKACEVRRILPSVINQIHLQRPRQALQLVLCSRVAPVAGHQHQLDALQHQRARASGSSSLERRAIIALILAAGPAGSALAVLDPVTIQPQLAPDQSRFDAANPRLRAAAAKLQAGLQAVDVTAEERAWTAVIDEYGSLDEPWVPDVVGRAWGNRGNARSRQGKLQEALSDYNEAIRICPWSPDPVLNRGVVLEAMGRWEEAITDYRSVLAVLPQDPSAWNNIGNASAGLGRWDDAAEFFGRAVALAPEFSFAAANKSLALYQLGQQNEAMREMRALLRRYPDFPDMRAGLAAALWAQGKEGEAETQWQRLDDPRYKDLTWLRANRRWPPSLITAWEAFLSVQSVPTAQATASRVGA